MKIVPYTRIEMGIKKLTKKKRLNTSSNQHWFGPDATVFCTLHSVVAYSQLETALELEKCVLTRLSSVCQVCKPAGVELPGNSECTNAFILESVGN